MNRNTYVKPTLVQALSALAICCALGCQPAPVRTGHGDAPFVKLDYTAFDQQPGSGWRELADQGKYLEAAWAIDTYEIAREDLKPGQRVNLRFHAGQSYAFAGETETALARFRSAVVPDEPADAPIRWNAYVGATIAFLERDRPRLLALRKGIAAGPKLRGKVPNLDVVDRLIAGFDRPYAEAYGGRGTQP